MTEPLWTKENHAASLDKKKHTTSNDKKNHAASQDKKDHATFWDKKHWPITSKFRFSCKLAQKGTFFYWDDFPY